MKAMFATVGLLVCSVWITGCGGGDGQKKTSADGGTKNVSRDGASSVVIPSDVDSDSPASRGAAALPVDASPEDVVLAFLNALRAGDERSAEDLLTDLARTETRQAGLAVQPPGTPSAKYSVGTAQYVTNKKERAQVSCLITETDASGQSESYTVGWVLKKQSHNGWRVAGMSTQFLPGKPNVFLNFENPADMLARWAQLEAEMNGQNGEVQTADQGTDPNGIRR